MLRRQIDKRQYFARAKAGYPVRADIGWLAFLAFHT
jgi:hypothetical protein